MDKNETEVNGIPALLQNIADEHKTGTLKIKSPSGEKYFYFRAGNILQACSPTKPSILAEGLRRHPEVDEESYQELCSQQKQTGKSLASLLLSDPNDGTALVNVICRFQILEEVCELFTWEDCQTEFTGPDPDQMLFDLELMNIEPVTTSVALLEASQRFDEWRHTLEVLPSKKDIPYRVVEQLPDNADTAMNIIYKAIDGFRSIEEILACVRLSPFSARKSLVELVQQNLVAIKNAKELLQLARLDVFRENLVKRTDLYERALELGEQSSDISLWLANSYETLGMNNKAAQQYQDLGYFYLNCNRWPQATDAFDKVATLDPENLDAQERLVSLLAYLGRWEQYAQKMGNYARWLALKGQSGRAILLLCEAVEKYPHQLDNFDLLGALYQEAGHKHESIRSYEHLAHLRAEKQQFTEAATAWQKIIQIDMNHLEARKNLGQILNQLGRNKEATEQYQNLGKMITSAPLTPTTANYLIFAAGQLATDNPQNLIARQWLAKGYLIQNQTTQAIHELREILARKNNEQDLELAVETLKTLVQLEPKDLAIRFNLAEIYLQLHKEREAVQEYFNLGMSAIEQNQNSKALEAFNALLNLDPAHYATHIKKAELLRKEDHNEEAMEELMLTGYLSLGSDKLWQAVKAFSEVIRMDRDAYPACYWQLGKLYEKLNKPQEAIASYKKHAQKNAKLQNFGEALRSCDKILTLEPQNNWAQIAKQKILAMLPKIAEILQANTEAG